MKERPIIFSSPMVRAILEGRKTMTRRVINWKNIAKQSGCTKGSLAWSPTFNSFAVFNGNNEVDVSLVDCPYGKPGDRLWVRETYRLPDGAPKGWVDYRADDSRDGFKWRPSIYMPRRASRIDLEIVSVRVERLQDISNKDIESEGACERACVTHRLSFQHLWDSINAKRGYGWDVNPWVWVVEFKRIEKE